MLFDRGGDFLAVGEYLEHLRSDTFAIELKLCAISNYLCTDTQIWSKHSIQLKAIAKPLSLATALIISNYRKTGTTASASVKCQISGSHPNTSQKVV